MNVIDYSWDFTKEEFSLDLDFFNEKEQEDKLWQARTGLDHETLCGAIETIIFMSDRPVNLLKIKNQIDSDLPLRVVHESIARLQEEYEKKHHGIRLMEVAQGYQFRTKATYSKVVQKMFKVTSMQLSPTALEVLAIIAYKQPISKTAIESIRGVDSSHVVRQLMDKRLVRICGRSEEMGRPSLYGTSAEFLEVFNLNDTNELPSETELDELASASDVASINEIKTIVQKGDKKLFEFDEFEELDELSQSIRDIASDTVFTKSLLDMDKKRTSEEGVEKKSAFDLLEEYVNQAQIVEQNKASILSDVLTSVMQPRPVDVTSTEELFNVPALEDAIDLSELPRGEFVHTEEFDEEEIDGAETSLDESNLAAEEAMENFITAEEAIEEVAQELSEQESQEEVLKTEEQELDEALDAAFENLMGSFDDEETEEIEASEEQDDSEIIDLSGLSAEDLDIDIDFIKE